MTVTIDPGASATSNEWRTLCAVHFAEAVRDQWLVEGWTVQPAPDGIGWCDECREKALAVGRAYRQMCDLFGGATPCGRDGERT